MKAYNTLVSWIRKVCRKIPNDNKIVWVEPNDDGSVDIYHTDSPFWYNFFHSDEISKDVKIGDKIDWNVITYKGKIIMEMK